MATQGGVDHASAVSEVDRYFSNPTQALGYMLGQRRFLELRARAERALGPGFDIRDFHAVVIDNGPVTLTVLEKLVDAWIAGRGGRARETVTRNSVPESPAVLNTEPPSACANHNFRAVYFGHRSLCATRMAPLG